MSEAKHTASNTFTSIGDKPIRWTDKAGLTHVCEGADVHRGVRLIWTLCERDVPANSSWLLQPGDNHELCMTCGKRARERGLIQ